MSLLFKSCSFQVLVLFTYLKRSKHLTVHCYKVEESSASLCGGVTVCRHVFIAFKTWVSSSGSIRPHPLCPAAAELCINTHRSISCATATHYNVIPVFNMWSLHQYLIINITAGVLTVNMGPAGD